MGSVAELFQRAVLAFSSGDSKRAEELTNELLKLDQENVEGYSLLASIHQQDKQYKKALEPAQRATQLEPDNLQHWNRLGFLYLILGQWKEGEKTYAKAAKMKNATPTIFLNHAWALIELDKKDAAIKQLGKAIAQSLEDTVTETIKEDDHYTKLRPLVKKVKK